MLIEHIFQFELKEPWRPSRRPTCTPTTGKESFRVDYYLLLKYCSRQCMLLSSILGPNHLQNLAPKCKILNMF